MELLFGWMLKNTTDDYYKMLSRLEKIPLRNKQIIDLMTSGVENNITYHAVSMRNMNSSLGRFVVEDPRDSPLYVYFEDDFPDSFTDEDIEHFQTLAQTAINEYVSYIYEFNSRRNSTNWLRGSRSNSERNGTSRVEEDTSPDTTSAYYISGSYDGTRPGVFYVSTYDPSTQPKYSMLTLSLHEGEPGHHLQLSHAIESPDFPYFRRVTEDRNYGFSPSRFPLYTYYCEGWALYAEGLGFDMNLYTDLLDRLRWTVTLLGQVKLLPYKIGQLKISELRSKSEEELGDLFDIKDFHEVILDSFGSLDIVESEVDKWINETLSNNI
ncbi:hypothetical protein Avbf_08584 [Armadillidium vulgare]|nr:hypothetical protein Avbf_08584 [Armadillidium vulgare]